MTQFILGLTSMSGFVNFITGDFFQVYSAGASSATQLSDGRVVVVVVYVVPGATDADTVWYAQILDPQGQPVSDRFALQPDATAGIAQSIVGVQALTDGTFLTEWATGAYGTARESYFTTVDQTGSQLTGPVWSPIVISSSDPRPVLSPLASGDLLETSVVVSANPWGAAVISQLIAPNGLARGNAINIFGPQPGAVALGIRSVGLAGGGYVVSWLIGDYLLPTNDKWQAQIFAADGTAIGSAISICPSTTAQPGEAPVYQELDRLLALPDGSFATLSNTSSGTGYSYQAYSPLGAAVGPAIDLTFTELLYPSSGKLGLVIPPQVSVMADGNLLIVWQTNHPVADGMPFSLQTYADIYTPAGSLVSKTSLPGISKLISGTLLADGQLLLVGQTQSGSLSTVAIDQPPAATACFAAGTRIRTTQGEIAVERLAVGAYLPVRLGEGDRRIVWIGHRRVDCARHPRPHDVWPVRVQAHAFAPGQPHSDLLLSPDHAVFVDGVLIPVRYLVNGRSVAHEQVASVTYYHVELDAHDVILAEGLPCESYLDTGNRCAFANAGAARPVMLHADFARATWDAAGCAPLILAGARLAAVKRRLLAAAAIRGGRPTADSDLRVLVDGREVETRTDGMSWRARLPDGARTVRIVSRVWVPAHMRAGSDDTRRLGVALSAIRLDGAPVARDDARLQAGWHAAEPEWRWTDGAGTLAVCGARDLRIDVAMTGSHWPETPDRRRRAA